MHYVINQINNIAVGSIIFKLVILAVIADTVFGVLRAIKERQFNSCIGIDGAIRKIAMIFSLGFCIATDVVVSINLIGFLPDFILNILKNVNMDHVGLMDFFGILFIIYEILSILKNMKLCGLPVEKVLFPLYKFLKQYTSELPDMDELDEMVKGDDENGKEDTTD